MSDITPKILKAKSRLNYCLSIADSIIKSSENETKTKKQLSDLHKISGTSKKKFDKLLKKYYGVDIYQYCRDKHNCKC
tara:strand:- start:1609 stop:1842 length:234 start_codon:yes stop_codon:yes gene_type:complete